MVVRKKSAQLSTCTPVVRPASEESRKSFAPFGNISEALQLLRLPQVLAIVPVSRSSWWAGIQDGLYPRPLRIGPRSVAWRLTDIKALIATFESEAEANRGS